MDPVLILKAAQVGIGAAGSISMTAKLSSIEGMLDALKQQNDQLITREFLGAFDAIEEAIRSENPTTVETRLKFAEESLLRNSNLNEQITIADQPTSYWMALAHLGLGYVAALRGDLHIAARRLLRAFIAEPRQARTEYLAEMFHEVFEPGAEEIKSNYESRLTEIDEAVPKSAAKIQAAMAVGMNVATIIFPVASIVGMLGLGAISISLTEEQREDLLKALSLPPRVGAEKIAEIIAQARKGLAKGVYESELDKYCVNAAKQLLDSEPKPGQ